MTTGPAANGNEQAYLYFDRRRFQIRATLISNGIPPVRLNSRNIVFPNRISMYDAPADEVYANESKDYDLDIRDCG